MLVAYGELRLFPGTALYPGKEFGKLLWRGQIEGSLTVGADTSKFMLRLGILPFSGRFGVDQNVASLYLARSFFDLSRVVGSWN
ncbi:MAG: hypothetical protein HY799_06710 [Nitrosomonadales bacterium]|nr:hypothetical protein [Nitrosomonadales bacterium]